MYSGFLNINTVANFTDLLTLPVYFMNCLRDKEGCWFLSFTEFLE